MATPEEEISALEADIAKYEDEFANAAPGSEDEETLADLITAIHNRITECRKTINLLLQLQQPR
jgi:hypothetical protein